MENKNQPVGVIGAMEIEVDAVLSAMEEKEETALGSMVFTRGRLSGMEAVVARCAPGKVNAALCAQAMIDRFAPRLVLNIGVAGGIGEGVRIGDVVIADACVEYDFNVSAADEDAGPGDLYLPDSGDKPIRYLPCDQDLAGVLARQSQGLYGGTHRGVVATGDRFVADPAFGEYLQKEFGALACEMEGGAIAHVCLVNQVPCAVLRTISDNAHDSETVDFATFAQSSAQKAQELLARVLPQL